MISVILTETFPLAEDKFIMEISFLEWRVLVLYNETLYLTSY